MIGPSFVDEIDCGSFFDHIDDLLDFPADDVDAATFLPPAAANCESFPSMWSDHHESESRFVFSGKSASDLSAELSVPYEDIVQLEWLSNFVEDSFSGGSLTITNKHHPTTNADSSLQQFQTSSPVSVLESSSSCSGGGDKPAPPPRCGRARSKRPRPPAFNPRPAIHLIPPTPPPNSDNFAESRSRPPPKTPKKPKTTTKTTTIPLPLAPPQAAVRKCLHCEITKTPQWRAGPLGPKTLCNACGVRHKSGRLFPEYRPAASPTFVPSVHSNSHKKVLEMRNSIPESSADTEMIPNSTVQELQLEFVSQE